MNRSAFRNGERLNFFVFSYFKAEFFACVCENGRDGPQKSGYTSKRSADNYIITIEKRARVLKGEEACWLAKKRQTRCHAFSEGTRKLVQDIWAHSVSRPTGNKNDTMRNHVQRKV